METWACLFWTEDEGHEKGGWKIKTAWEKQRRCGQPRLSWCWRRHRGEACVCHHVHYLIQHQKSRQKSVVHPRVSAQLPGCPPSLSPRREILGFFRPRDRDHPCPCSFLIRNSNRGDAPITLRAPPRFAHPTTATSPSFYSSFSGPKKLTGNFCSRSPHLVTSQTLPGPSCSWPSHGYQPPRFLGHEGPRIRPIGPSYINQNRLGLFWGLTQQAFFSPPNNLFVLFWETGPGLQLLPEDGVNPGPLVVFPEPGHHHHCQVTQSHQITDTRRL